MPRAAQWGGSGVFPTQGLSRPFAPSLRYTAESRATRRPARSPPSSRGCRGGQWTLSVYGLRGLSAAPPNSTHARTAHTRGPHVWLSRLILILLVTATATHRTSGLAGDSTAERREATERLLDPAQGSQPSFPATLGTTHTGPGPPTQPRAPPALPPRFPRAFHLCPWPGPCQVVCAAAGGVKPHCTGLSGPRGDREGARLQGRWGPGAEPHRTGTLQETPGVQRGAGAQGRGCSHPLQGSWPPSPLTCFPHSFLGQSPPGQGSLALLPPDFAPSTRPACLCPKPRSVSARSISQPGPAAPLPHGRPLLFLPWGFSLQTRPGCHHHEASPDPRGACGTYSQFPRSLALPSTCL